MSAHRTLFFIDECSFYLELAEGESNSVQIEMPEGTNPSETDPDSAEQRKASAIPTLMITVKNDMAKTTNEPTLSTPGHSSSISTHVDRFIALPRLADAAETATLRHIFSDAAYYLIKSGNEENVSLAKAKVNSFEMQTNGPSSRRTFPIPSGRLVHSGSQ